MFKVLPWFRPGMILGLIFLLTSLCPVAAGAGEGEEKKEVKLDAMTVTAQKRSENIQDIPIAIDAFGEVDLEDAGIRNIKEVTRFAPNVYMRVADPESVTVIRGIPSFEGSIFAPVGFYVDDVSYAMHYSHSLELMDIERIEILKGPQGTLYGRNSESGVVNIVTRQPDNDFRAKLSADIATDNTLRLEAGMSTPLVRDRLYLGVAALKKNSDGYMTNIYDNDDEAGSHDSIAGRINLRWTPSRTLDISLVGDGMSAENNLGYYHFGTGEDNTGRHEVNHNHKTEDPKERNMGATLRVKAKFAPFNLISVTGFRDYQNDFTSDSDMGRPAWGDGIARYKYNNDSMSQEIRLSSPEGQGPLKWVTGLFAFSEDTESRFRKSMNFPPRMDVFAPATQMESSGYAAFGQATYTLGSQWHLTAGLRYDHQDLEGSVDCDTNWVINNTGGMPPYAPFDMASDVTHEVWLPKFSLAYDWNSHAMSYVSASKGYQSGGYNYFMPGHEADFFYEPESCWSYEFGTKTTWLDDKLAVNFALFYTTIEDKQVQETSPVDPNAVTVANAEKAVAKGAELEIKMRPVRGLDLFAGIGLTDSTFDAYKARTAAGIKDVAGNYVPNVPRYTYNIGAQYRMENGLFMRADLMGTGKAYADVDNTAVMAAHELVNLRLGYTGESYDIVFWAKNLFDETYDKYRFAPGDGSQILVDGEPRSFGLSLTYRF